MKNSPAARDCEAQQRRRDALIDCRSRATGRTTDARLLERPGKCLLRQRRQGLRMAGASVCATQRGSWPTQGHFIFPRTPSRPSMAAVPAQDGAQHSIRIDPAMPGNSGSLTRLKGESPQDATQDVRHAVIVGPCRSASTTGCGHVATVAQPQRNLSPGETPSSVQAVGRRNLAIGCTANASRTLPPRKADRRPDDGHRDERCWIECNSLAKR